MPDLSLFRNLFDYDYWANRRALESLATAGEAERPRKFFNHILGAQRVWLARFNSETPAAEPWPALSLEEARAALEDLHGRWLALLNGMTPEKLAADLAHRNSKGQEFRTPVADVLMHLVMHSVYHRGQVAAAVREAGGKPAATDYVVYVRQLKS
jgi:uncharacterized damage-inducible protein DinB